MTGVSLVTAGALPDGAGGSRLGRHELTAVLGAAAGGAAGDTEGTIAVGNGVGGGEFLTDVPLGPTTPDAPLRAGGRDDETTGGRVLGGGDAAGGGVAGLLEGCLNTWGGGVGAGLVGAGLTDGGIIEGATRGGGGDEDEADGRMTAGAGDGAGDGRRGPEEDALGAGRWTEGAGREGAAAGCLGAGLLGGAAEEDWRAGPKLARVGAGLSPPGAR